MLVSDFHQVAQGLDSSVFLKSDSVAQVLGKEMKFLQLASHIQDPLTSPIMPRNSGWHTHHDLLTADANKSKPGSKAGGASE